MTSILGNAPDLFESFLLAIASAQDRVRIGMPLDILFDRQSARMKFAIGTL